MPEGCCGGRMLLGTNCEYECAPSCEGCCGCGCCEEDDDGWWCEGKLEGRVEGEDVSEDG